MHPPGLSLFCELTTLVIANIDFFFAINQSKPQTNRKDDRRYIQICLLLQQ